ncbi:3'-5' RNA helicase ythdc2 [Homalodisca vitripennis]|nr:3'-5' RNA helicase ythdc2 [Homalodisca vitripennis]
MTAVGPKTTRTLEAEERVLEAVEQVPSVSTRGIASIVGGVGENSVSQEIVELEGYLKQDMDRCLAQAWASGTEQAFTQLLQLILSENISVDYQHSDTGLTALMAAAARGSVDMAEHLLSLGAKVNIKAGSDERTALDWATENGHQDVVGLLQVYMIYYEYEPCKPDVEVELSEESKLLIDVYERCFDEEQVDVDLIIHILSTIHESGKKGAVLIFLPGYDHIVSVKDRILANEKKFNEYGKLAMFILHSKMQVVDQKRIFQPVHTGQRKVILSTNIAETSITIDDVMYVIDSGKVREKSYNAVTNVYTQKCEWISQACARQRRGRAGRSQPGVCYHLFSSRRYRAMPPSQTPEILREPLQELIKANKNYVSKIPDIQEAEDMNYVGIALHNILTWTNHIDNLCLKPNSSLYALRRTHATSTLKYTKLQYYALFENHLRYGIAAWGSHNSM